MSRKNAALTWVAPYKMYVIMAAISGIVCAGMNVVVSDILKRVIDMASQKNMDGILPVIIAGVIVLIAGMAANYAVIYTTGYFGTHIVRDIRKQLIEHLVKTKPDYMERSGFGDILARMTQDVDGIRAFAENYLSDCIYVPVMVCVFSVYLCYLQPFLFMITIGPLIILVTLTTKLLTPVKLSQKRYSQMLGEANDNIKEACDGSSVIKAFSMEQSMYNRFQKKLYNCLKIGKRNDWLQYRVAPLSSMIYDLPIISAMIVGGLLCFRHKITIGSLVAFVSLLKILIDPLSEVYQLWVNSKSAMANLERIQFIFDEPIEDDREKMTEEITGEMAGEITEEITKNPLVYEIRNLSFAYQKEQEVLQHIDLTIKEGSRTAFVGMSGSGKSTLLKMLYRHYDNYAGEVLFYGCDMRKMKSSAIRDHIALISQSPFLFPMTVEENIRIGKQNATETEIVQAAKLAACHDFIMQLPQGYQTLIGENGASLSGGQLQRLSIARAVIKNADILLLDEPTSALDEESEQQVSKAIEQICKDKSKTIISIAHRLSTIKDYDQIILFDHGIIAEQGTHDELIIGN